MKTLIALLLMTTAVSAQAPPIPLYAPNNAQIVVPKEGKWQIPGVPEMPTEEQKIRILKRAYRLNGNSMVGDKMIDLTAPRVIQTVPEIPVADPANKNKLDALADVNLTPPPQSADDPCAKDHMHKKITHGGRSWRCRK